MKTICFAILGVSLISTAEACLPSSPADVLVGRIASIEKGGELQRESQARFWLKIHRLSLGISHMATTAYFTIGAAF